MTSRATEGGGAPGQCGWLTDKHGVSWQIVPKQLPKATPIARANRAVQAMLKMQKIDIAVLERAAAG